MRWLGWLAVLGVVTGSPAGAADALAPYRVQGDAIREPLAPEPGDAARGKQVVVSRESNCLLCHAVPDSGVRAMGNLGPPLNGTGARLSDGQLRLRVVDSMRVNPETIMPSYHRVEGFNQVGAAWRGKPILNAQQVEDVVAYLRTLR